MKSIPVGRNISRVVSPTSIKRSVVRALNDKAQSMNRAEEKKWYRGLARWFESEKLRIRGTERTKVSHIGGQDA